MSYSKQKLAFYRKLYLAYLIDNGEYNVPMLEKITGMPRRTIQDCIKVLEDISIEVSFQTQEGKRNNDGIYRISSWGPIDRHWVASQMPHIGAVLGVKSHAIVESAQRSRAARVIAVHAHSDSHRAMQCA
jgi:hypothetical protein